MYYFLPGGGILLQQHRDANRRCIEILFKSIRSQGSIWLSRKDDSTVPAVEVHKSQFPNHSARCLCGAPRPVVMWRIGQREDVIIPFLPSLLLIQCVSVPLSTIQSEAWLVHEQVRQPRVNPPVRMNFRTLSLVLEGKATKVHMSRWVHMWFANLVVDQPCLRLDCKKRYWALSWRWKKSNITHQHCLGIICNIFHVKFDRDQKINTNFSGQSFSSILRVMDVHTKNRGRLLPELPL